MLLAFSAAWAQEESPADDSDATAPPAAEAHPTPGLRFTATWEWSQLTILDLEAVDSEGAHAADATAEIRDMEAVLSQGDRVYPAVPLEYG